MEHQLMKKRLKIIQGSYYFQSNFEFCIVVLLRALDDMYDMFYFNVTLHHTYYLEVNQSRSYEDIKQAVLDEIRFKLSPLKTASRFASLVFFVTFCIMVLRY